MKKIKIITTILAILCSIPFFADLFGNGDSVWWNNSFRIIPTVRIDFTNSSNNYWKRTRYPGDGQQDLPMYGTKVSSIQEIAMNSVEATAYADETNENKENKIKYQIEGPLYENQVYIAHQHRDKKTSDNSFTSSNELSDFKKQNIFNQTSTLPELTHPGGNPLGKPIDNVPIGSQHCLYIMICLYVLTRFRKQINYLMNKYSYFFIERVALMLVV